MAKKSKVNGASTRMAILSELKTNGPQDAEALADRFGLTGMAIRQHLYALQEQGDVEHVAIRQAKGRPRKKWELTEQANSHFANSHAALAVDLIDAMKRTFGDQGLERLVAARTEDQIAAYRLELKDASTLFEQLNRLAEIRTREGYMAALTEGEQEGEYLLIENHCPICEAARSCTSLCSSELSVFEAVLGDRIELERLDHILLGARRCVYRCREKAAL
ncbi:MAG: transcriptional regulator [Sneathiellales bacterium]|nr:transcriptional regulator [Sneathiellales bacterium]